jgi:hypothetical protein
MSEQAGRAYSEDERREVWDSLQHRVGDHEGPRPDYRGTLIVWSEYGQRSEHGWVIAPVDASRLDGPGNPLVALHYRNHNRRQFGRLVDPPGRG